MVLSLQVFLSTQVDDLSEPLSQAMACNAFANILNKGAQLSPQQSTNRKSYLLVKPVEQRSNSQYGARLFITSCKIIKWRND